MKRRTPKASRDGGAPRKIAILTFPGAQTLDVTGPYEVFAIASEISRRRKGTRRGPYQVEIVAVREGGVPSWSGLELVAHRALANLRGEVDTLVVAGGEVARRTDAPEMAPLVSWLRRSAPRIRRVASVCTGAFLLAEAGLLDGRRATTHWRAAAELARRHPAVDVDPDAIFVSDANVYSSAGITAGMDLALALVEEDLGRDLALDVAREMVMFLKRPGGQSQFSAVLSAQQHAGDRLDELPQWIREHLDQDLCVDALARHSGMSPRNFARVFSRSFGVTPARYVEIARIERARELLEDGRHSLDEIAVRCGFGGAERLRGSFVRHVGVLPRDYRLRFRRSQLRRVS